MDSSDKITHKQKPIPIGVDNYKVMIEGNYLHVDKTLLIKEFWENGAPVILTTRPRRFGKSITLSMLQCFFEKTVQSQAYLFKNTKIWKEEGFLTLQGTYPVINISFKDVKAKTWEGAYKELKKLLTKEIRRSLKPLLAEMEEDYKAQYHSFIKQTASEEDFNETLLFITEVFQECLGLKTIILIDEYDTPITHAYLHKFYDKMIDFMRQLLSKALKGNANLHKGFMTGVVRTSKDGILSGLNNLTIYTLLDAQFSDKFGFSEEETDRLLTSIGHLDKKEELKSWYNGYVVGSTHLHPSKIYNPWSVLAYMQYSCTPKTYWVNTGSPELLIRLIAEADEEIQKEIILLMEGKSLEKKEINQDVILLELDEKGHEPWSFLLFAGYITAVDHVFQNNKHYYTLAIPNVEIAELYQKLVKAAIGRTFSSSKLIDLHDALIAGNDSIFSSLLEDFIGSMCSFHDLPKDDLERSLHLFVLGLLASLTERYTIKSNLESGTGRYDIFMHPRKPNDFAVVIEFKKGKEDELEKLAEQALQQIKEHKYESMAKDFGYRGKVICYGIAGFKKRLVTKMEIKHTN